MAKTTSGLTPADRIRVGRDEREHCIDELQDHYAAGRLGDAELAERVGSALSATTRADLELVLEDLPGVRVAPAGRRRARRTTKTLAAAAAVALLGIGAVAMASESPESWSSLEQTTCLSTGEQASLETGCPEPTAVQQQILADADAADRAAQQLQEAADRNPEVALGGLLERAWVSSGRARDAVQNSQQIVRTAQGEPAEKLLAGPAGAAERAAEDTQTTLDLALDRLGR